MKAIITKYLGPSNTRGSRIKATEPDGKSITISWNHALSAEANHSDAARMLMDKLGWLDYDIATGALKDAWVHVLVCK